MLQQKINYDFFDYSNPDLNNTILQTLLEKLEAGESIKNILETGTAWEYYYHLSPVRENVIDLCQIEKNDKVLEIGAEAGALTGALARRCTFVDCVTPSELMAKISEFRYRALDNINIYVGELEQICFTKKYDVITLFGTLEKAPQYMKTPNPYLSLLQMAHSLLKPGGRLYIGGYNRFGLRYFAGYYDEHTRNPFGGIAGGDRKNQSTTFSRSELVEMVAAAGFQTPYFYYPFPDYAFPKVAYSDDYFPMITSYMDVKTNYMDPRVVCFDENQVYPTLTNIEERKMFANSFVIEAIKGDI